MSEPSTPPVIEGYRIVGPLGRGSMGSVWRAFDRGGREVAVKVFDRAKRVTDEQLGGMYRREAVACLNLRHPSLARGLEVGETTQGRLFLALELVEGETLTERILARGPVPERELLPIAHALASGLEHAHALGLLHRDVKPDNVMLPAEGGAKLVDFSLVTEVGHGELGCGSPGYASPEMIRKQDVGPRSDLYALGVTLAAAALGRPYFEGVTVKDVLRATLAKPLVLPARVGDAALSEDFRAVVARLGRKVPRERYGSAGELRLDLEAMMHGERALGAHMGGRRPTRGLRRAGSALAVAAVVASGAFLYARHPDGSATPNAAPDAPPAPPSPSTATDVGTEAGDAEIGAVLLYLAAHPGEYANGRRLLVERFDAPTTVRQRTRLEVARAALEARYDAEADALLAAFRASGKASLATGDPEGAETALGRWPEEFASSRQANEARRLATTWRASLLAEGGALVTSVATSLSAWEHGGAGTAAEADELLARIDARLPLVPTGATSRVALEAIRARVAASRDSFAVRERERASQQAIVDAWIVAPRDRGAARAALGALADGAAPARTTARLVADILSRADGVERQLAATTARVVGRGWAGVLGGRLVVARMTAAPSPDAVYGPAPAWSSASTPAGCDLADLLAAVGDGERAASWLVAKGWPEAASTVAPGDGDVRRLLDAAPPPRAERPPASDFWLGLSRRFEFTIRDADGPGPPIGASDGPVLAAWSESIREQARASRPTSRPGAAAASIDAARAAFLADDLLAAWSGLEQAAGDVPRDAEVAILRCRVLDALSGPLRTVGVEMFALSEARRAWDLERSLPAGSRLVAERALDVRARHPGAIAAALAPLALAACEEAIRLGQETAAMLAYVGERHLDASHPERAAPLLRRASLATPDEPAILLLLGRAEFELSDGKAAREALERARARLGGRFPDWARDLLTRIGAK